MSTKIYAIGMATEDIPKGAYAVVKIDGQGHATISLASPEDVPGEEDTCQS